MSIIAKYKFDGSIYADLIPEFNAEFTNYTITDRGNIIKDINWISDYQISLDTGEYYENPNCHVSDFINVYVQGLKCASNQPVDIFWYDENKNYIGGLLWDNNILGDSPSILMECPENAHYVRFSQYKSRSDLIVTGGEIIRTIESDELPTLMRFGRVYVDGESSTDNRTDSLLEVLDMNTSSTNCSSMFRHCKNVTSINLSNFNTLNVTRMDGMFAGCSNLISLDLSSYNTSKVNNMEAMFRNCSSLTSLDLSNFDTTNVTTMYAMFYNCLGLIELDISSFDTSNVTNMSSMFSYCSKLESLDVSDFNTVNVVDMSNMFNQCKKLTSLDVSNFNTSNVADMKAMFYNCQALTTLDVNNWNTSKVTNMQQVFDMCYALNVDVSNWNTSNATNIYAMFGDCRAMHSLDLTKWNTSKMTNMLGVFWGCNNLVELNISSWDTSKVTNMKKIFYGCSKLTTLDISNFNTDNVADTTDIFAYTPLLKDIGMLYCNQSTIETIASVLPTDTTQTIWVEDVDIKDLTPVEGVEFKQYAKNTEIMLTSPLLEGDKLIVKDGKLYHWHKMGKVVLDGSEDWLSSSYLSTNVIRFWTREYEGVSKGYASLYCDKFINEDDVETYRTGDKEMIHHDNQFNIVILKSKLSSLDIAGFRQWLSENPVTVVYELASPIYELISEDPLDISLIAESSDITNSSNIPLNMTINNKGLSTIAMSPSTTYTVAFDKDTDSEVVVNLCGNEITTTDNIVEITTPSEIDDELIFYGDGVEVSNVRLLEGNVSGDSVPKESFKGLKNSFEDGYIPENLTANIQPTLNNTSCATQYRWDNKSSEGGITVCTVYTTEDNISLPYRRKGIVEWVENTNVNKGISVYVAPEGMEFYCIQKDYGKTLTNPEPFQAIVLEGDWTHLTEEDFNHVGKYKVEYKVTGKNKAGDITPANGNSNDNHWIVADNNNGTYTVKSDGYSDSTNGFALKLHANVKPNTTYTFTYKVDGVDWNEGSPIFIYRDFYSLWDKTKFIIASQQTSTITFTTPSDVDKICIGFHYGRLSDAAERIISNIQLEEGTEATPYEPYKEYTKTFYLNSPLLEGDTIEDIGGKATHVHRSEKQIITSITQVEGVFENTSQCHVISKHNFLSGNSNLLNCDKFCIAHGSDDVPHIRFDGTTPYPNIKIYIPKIHGTSKEDVNKYLEDNPITIVGKLASPIYEPISTESILCDSYVNGHLDVDTNIPIEKVEFGYVAIKNVYLIPNTNYVIQFESDNVGKLDSIVLGGYSRLHNINVVKGLNKIKFYTLDNVGYDYIDLYGIGFNASNIQVVATDRDVNFGYFKGLQSSFESELITDETDENYGKYKVECKIVGKNKFNGILPEKIDVWNSSCYIKKGTYRFSATLSGFYNGTRLVIAFFDKDGEIITNTKIGYNTVLDRDCYKIYFYSNDYDYRYSLNNFVNISNFQIEEGTQVTSYEPYQEYTKTICLNSPLLKGDTIEVHNGKLCHYHKMGMVVLDGSEDWVYQDATTSCNMYLFSENAKPWRIPICDRLIGTFPKTATNHDSEGIGIKLKADSKGEFVLNINKTKLSTTDVTGFKQWLQANIVTVVYELVSPYYEEITPIQEDLIITSVKEGDLHIDTIVPISSKVTYNVNVQLLTDFEQSIVEQVQATQTTDLQSILDEEIDN